MLTAMNSGRGWHGQFFVQDLGLALAANTYPTTTVLQKDEKWADVSVARNRFSLSLPRVSNHNSKLVLISKCQKTVSRNILLVYGTLDENEQLSA